MIEELGVISENQCWFHIHRTSEAFTTIGSAYSSEDTDLYSVVFKARRIHVHKPIQSATSYSQI